MINNNILAPRLVALAKDAALEMYLDAWQDKNNFITYKDVISIFSENNIDLFEKSPIVIKEEFKHLNLPHIANMIEVSYKVIESVIKDTLRFIGNVNEGPGVNKFEWGHPHTH